MKKGTASQTDKGENVDLTVAIKWLNAAVINNLGHALKEPEIVILKGTWRGVTYEQMSHESEYSTNYLMRDVAPKLWKQLSNVFGRSVGKTNFRVALEAYVTANANVERELAAYELSNPSGSDFADATDGAAAKSGIYWHPAFASEPSSGVADSDNSNRPHPPLLEQTGLEPISVPAIMYGYTEELAQAKQWLSTARGSEEHSGLVGIWGLGGVGKTLLAETLAYQVGDRFDAVIWRSLKNQPSLEELSSSILMGLGVPPQPTQIAAQLLSLMAQKSILLILEGVEAILNPGQLAGEYKANYEVYGDFFQSTTGLRSCIVVMGIEGPAELTRQGDQSHHQSDNGQNSTLRSADSLSRKGSPQWMRHSVQSLTLTHLSEAAAAELLQAESLREPEHWPTLIERYQAHPLALKAASRVIRDFFNGRVDEFLKQTSVLFTDILRLLAPSFNRLSLTELNILYWLASQDEPLSLAELQQTLPLSLSSAMLISALDSLKQRSLLEIQTTSEEAPAFSLAPLVKAYAVHRFMDQFIDETQEDTTHCDLEASKQGARGTGAAYGVAKANLEPVINLSPSAAGPVQLSQWFQGQFDDDWNTLDRLFAVVSRPAMRIRNTYHLRDETVIKRFKPINLGKATGQNADPTSREAFLLVAIHRDGENLYKVSVQVQPAKTATVLPESLVLALRDTQQKVLATVRAQSEDSFIQLPYFRGSLSELFVIELTLGDYHHTETFTI